MKQNRDRFQTLRHRRATELNRTTGLEDRLTTEILSIESAEVFGGDFEGVLLTHGDLDVLHLIALLAQHAELGRERRLIDLRVKLLHEVFPHEE